jgi:hypothetical protein
MYQYLLTWKSTFLECKFHFPDFTFSSISGSHYKNSKSVFYVHVTEHCNKFLYNKTIQMHQFPKFTPAWNSTCFGKFLSPSSGVYSLYTWHWYMSYRFEDSFWTGPSWSCSKAVWHIPLLSVQWINSWWWSEELPKTCRVLCWSKFGKLVHVVGFTIKRSKSVFYLNYNMQHTCMIGERIWQITNFHCSEQNTENKINPVTT